MNNDIDDRFELLNKAIRMNTRTILFLSIALFFTSITMIIVSRRATLAYRAIYPEVPPTNRPYVVTNNIVLP